MNPTQAGALVRRARTMLRAGDITHHQFALLDCMVWSCRAPGSDRLCASYSKLQRLAHMARDTIARGISRLESLGLIRRVKQRVMVRWGLGIASRQATNGYVLNTESDQRPVNRVLENKILKPDTKNPTAGWGVGKESALDRALRLLGEAVRGQRQPGEAKRG